MYRCASVFALAGMLYSADGFAQNRKLNFSDMRDGVVMTGGKVMKIENGEATRIEDEVVLRDGTRVKANGTVVKEDGTEKRLREGRAVNERGHIVSAHHDMLSYEAILRHEYRKLGEKASPLAKAVGQEDTYAMERMGRFGGFEGSEDFTPHYMTEEQTQQFQQAEQRSTAFQQQLQTADQKMELLDQLLELTNQRLSMMESNMQANRRIDLPGELARLDQEIDQVESRLREVDQSSANMLRQLQDQSHSQQSMTRQGGYFTDEMQRQRYDMGQEGMEYGQQQYEMMERQSMAMQQRMQMMEEKFEMFNELLDLTNQRLRMMESSLSAHRNITLPAGIEQIDRQIEQVEEQLKAAERDASDMMRNQPTGQPYGSQEHQATPGHNNQATPTNDNE
jgi:hypothetical protein